MPTLSDPKAQCNPRPPKGVPVLVFVSFKLASFANFTTTGKLKLPHHLTTPLTTTDGPLFFPVSPHHQSCQESRGGEVGGDVEARWDPVHAPRLQANTRLNSVLNLKLCSTVGKLTQPCGLHGCVCSVFTTLLPAWCKEGMRSIAKQPKCFAHNLWQWAARGWSVSVSASLLPAWCKEGARSIAVSYFACPLAVRFKEDVRTTPELKVMGKLRALLLMLKEQARSNPVLRALLLSGSRRA
eukprot:scaffold64603_cov20-Tisochrysis_lutea.AAC.1